MVNDHVGPKGNQLKVWEPPLGHHLPEKRLHGLEVVCRPSRNKKSNIQHNISIPLFVSKFVKVKKLTLNSKNRF
jgi:hypothetical protein